MKNPTATATPLRNNDVAVRQAVSHAGLTASATATNRNTVAVREVWLMQAGFLLAGGRDRAGRALFRLAVQL